MTAEAVWRVWVQTTTWGGGGGVGVPQGMTGRGVPWPWSSLRTVGLVAALGTVKEILFFLFTGSFVFHLFMSLKCDLLFWIHFPAIQAWRGLFFFITALPINYSFSVKKMF